MSRVRDILSWYGSDNPGTLTNLARMLNHGRLAGMWFSRVSMAGVSSSSPVAQPQGMTRCLARSGRFVTVAVLARSLDATPSSGLSTTR